ncbi:MAG TPA: prepilin-type N-terminal cleavage/methylation domain-containing protein [Gemmatimonadales bacterium]|nr:prepilin-type N-terminal cleavage/methylation domain-containing protein [Gemmatimonadales bacterium]
MSGSRSGFTLVEVMVAVVVMTVGLLAVAAGSGSIYRMLAYGRRSTAAARVASTRLDLLRQQANRTSPRCTALASGTASLSGRVTETWTVSGTSRTRNIREVVAYPTSRGMTADTVFSTLECL